MLMAAISVSETTMPLGYCPVSSSQRTVRHPVWGDGYLAAMINYQFIAHAVLSTDETVDRMR
jgi:hypothetical protein